jgi:hypothetical protein
MGDYSLYRGRRVENELRGPDGIANALLFKRRYPGNEQLTFLLVEGDTDKRLYENFTDKKGCAIHIAYSKSTALDTLTILEQSKVAGILAIVDADFDILDGKNHLSPNVFLTDAHDAESTIIQSPALEKLLSEFGSEPKIEEIKRRTGKDIRALLLDGSKTIGYARWISLRKGFALKFEGLDLHKCFDRHTFMIDEMKALDHIRNKSQQLHISAKQIQADIAEIQSDRHDVWHVCCGHDLTMVLSLGLRVAWGTHDHHEVTQPLIETSLRLAYEYAHFKKTHLYAALQAWEVANRPFLILRREEIFSLLIAITIDNESREGRGAK